jgi:hypothetical protein
MASWAMTPDLPDFSWEMAAFSRMINDFVCFPHPRSGKIKREIGRDAYKVTGNPS